MNSIHPFMPTSNLIVERPQITLKLTSKDVEKVVFQKMKKSFQFDKVNKLVFMFSVTSKVRIYENLKNVFQEAMGENFFQAKHHEKSDIVENYLQHPLDLSSKNVKNAFFEYMTRHRSESGTTFITFTFTLLSTDPIYAKLEGHSSKESKESEKNNPPPVPLATHPYYKRAVSNPLYGWSPQPTAKETPQLTKEKSLLKRTMGSIKKCFTKKAFPMPQARYTLHAFDSGFECGSENFKGSLNSSHNKDPIYQEIENVRERKSSEDSGYETIPSPRESIRGAFSDSDYEIPRQIEPAIYLEVLP